MRLLCLAFATLLLPAMASANNVVPKEQIIASPQGTWYVIVQPRGDFDIVKRSPEAPPMRNREGKAPVTDAQLRLGATADEVMRSAGLPGLRPDPGDAIFGGGRLRNDPLDRMHVFDDGSGFVARYAKGPSNFEGVEPVREADGSDVALIAVDSKEIGPQRTPTRFVHLYTLKDAIFWGDAGRNLVVMVAGGANVVLTEARGARILERGRGRRPTMLAWSLTENTTVDAPLESLFEQMSSLQSRAGLTALLLAREIAPKEVLEPLQSLVLDPKIPHVTRLHAATTLRAHGRLHGTRTILRTAWGLDKPTPAEQPIAHDDGVPGEAEPLRDFAISVLPASHGDGAIDDLVRLATGEDERIAEIAEAALLEGPWPETSRFLPTMAHLARDRSKPVPVRALATRLLVARSDARVGELMTWLAGEAEAAISEPVLEVFGDRIGDEPVIAAIQKGFAADDLEESSLRAGLATLAERSWRSEAAREAVLALVPEPEAGALADDDDSAVAEADARVILALGTLWRIDDPRVAALLDAWSRHDDARAAKAAQHSAELIARAQPSAQNP